jgi:hypothetical protein
MATNTAPDAVVRWDRDAVRRFMDAARRAPSGGTMQA